MSEAEGLYDAEYSDSDSDDESETGLSEESDSESSDGSDVQEGEEEEEDDDDITEESQIVAVQPVSGASSDEGGEKESCPICLNRFIGQDLGTPESCDHIFCLECIREWSKNINTCPIDRTEFNYVNLRSTPNGKILKRIKVKVRPKEPENALQQEVTVCEVCHLGDREDRLLLCDACDLAYHCECLDPPLFHVPIEEWFCPPCRTVLQNGAVAGPSVPRGSRRVIPRTRASENVRTRVEDRRTRPPISRSPSVARKRAPQKRKRRAYRRATYKKVVTLARTKKNLMDGSKGKDCPRSTAVIVTYRRRRRRRKRRRVAKKSTTATKSSSSRVNKRISKHLGLVESSKGGSIPDVKPKSKSSSKPSSSSSHYLFGDRNQLMDFNESFFEDDPGPSRRQPEATPQASSSINLLDSIIAGQKILHTKSNDVIIKTDGSLVLKENKPKEKPVFKKPISSDRAKEKEPVKKPNTSEKMNEKLKETLKKSGLYDKTKEQGKGIIKKPDASKKAKFGSVTFGEPSELGAVPKSEKHFEQKPSPMLLAALARRRENETFNQYASDSKSTSSTERVAATSDNSRFSLHNQYDQNMNAHNNSDSLNSSKQSSFSVNSKMNKSSYAFETMDKPSYSNEASNKKSGKDCQVKSVFDDFRYSQQFSSSSSYQSFPCPELKYETDNKRFRVKHENGEKSPKHSNKHGLNKVSRLHGAAHSSFTEESRSVRQSSVKNENVSSNGHVKKAEKFIKKETNGFHSMKSVAENRSKNATMDVSSETEINFDEDDTMELNPSQSLILGNSEESLTLPSNVKQFSLNIKKEPYSLSKSSHNTIESLHKHRMSKPHSQKSSNDFKPKIKIELESSDDECWSPNMKSNDSSIESHKQTVSDIIDDDDTMSFDGSQSIITPSMTETAAKNTQRNGRRLKKEINSSDDEVDISDVLKAYSQSKSLNKLRNDKKVSDDFSKIKIKKELPSSEDEGGESASLLTGDLLSTQLAVRNSFPCNNLISKEPTSSNKEVMNFVFNEQMNDLPCTQLAESTCNPKDKSLFGHSSKSLSNKPGNLPCNQLAEFLDEQGDDLPCTQMVKPTSSKSLSNEEDDLPCTQLVKTSSKKSVFNEEDTLPCTQLARPISGLEMEDLPCTQVASHISSMRKADLPNTQFAVPAPMRYPSKKKEDALLATKSSIPSSKMQKDNLPSTQLVGTSSQKSISNEEEALPCTQLARPVSSMEEEDLPCTQLARPLSNMQTDDLSRTQSAVPATVKYPFEKVDDLPGTQPSSPLSDIEMDDLPCTQILEPSLKKSGTYEDDSLPCTQLARSLSSIQTDDLPSIQLAKSASVKPHCNKDNLPSTQFAIPASVKYPSRKKENPLPATQPSNPPSQMQMDDLPCTQLAETLSKRYAFNEEDDALPCTQLARAVSDLENEVLPCTQLARPLSYMQMDDLPSTQFASHAPIKYPFKKENDLPSTQPSSPVSDMEMDDLPCTQLLENDSLPCTQLARPFSSIQIDDLPSTQLVEPLSVKPHFDKDDLPSTQFAVPAPVKYSSKTKETVLQATQPSNPLSQMHMDDLPCTQLADTSSKKHIFNEEEDSLPCTQLARPVSNLENEDLPCTQLAMPQSTMPVEDLPCTQLAVPASLKYPLKKEDDLPGTQPSSPVSDMEMEDLPCTQRVKSSSVKSFSDKEDDTLPCTQLAIPVASLHSSESSKDNPDQNTSTQSKRIPAYNKKLLNDNGAQKKPQHPNNFQKARNSPENLPATQPNTNIESGSKNTENLNNLNSDDNFDLPETQPVTIDQHNLNDEQVTDKELLSIIEKLKTKKSSPAKKVVGVHRNLPQVLMPIPSRRFPILKPSNKITFSFDQVKQEYDSRSNKNKEHENISHEGKCLAPKIADMSSKQRLSSLLKKEQVSSKSKTENSGMSKALSLADKPKISVSSISNGDVKTEVADSEIQIIDNAERMKLEKVEEVVLSSDEEDLPATQFIDRTSHQCSDFTNHRKIEIFSVPIKKERDDCIEILPETQQCSVFGKSAKDVNANGNASNKFAVKKEITTKDFGLEIGKTVDPLSVKQEKCEENIENILKEIKREPLQQLKTEEQIRSKSKNKANDLKDVTDFGTIHHVEKLNSKNISANNISRCGRNPEKDVKEHKMGTDITSHSKKSARDRSSSFEDKLKFERDKKIKTISSSETRFHSNPQNKTETKSDSRSLSKTSSNSKIKVNTDNGNEIKLVSKDKKSKTESASSSDSHTKNHSSEKHKSLSKEDSYYKDHSRSRNHVISPEKHKSSKENNSHSHSKNHTVSSDKHKSSSKEDNYKNHSHSKIHTISSEKYKSSKENYREDHSHTEKRNSSSKEDNYHEDSKRRKLYGLDDSKKLQDSKKLKINSSTVKTEPETDESGQHGSEKSFNTRLETHKLKINIKTENNNKHESLKKSVKTDKISNLGKVKENYVSNDGKTRNDNKLAEDNSKNSSRLSSNGTAKVSHSSSHDTNTKDKHLDSYNKCKESRSNPYNDKERLNGRSKRELDSEKNARNQFKESKTFSDQESLSDRIKSELDSEKNTRNQLRESKTFNDEERLNGRIKRGLDSEKNTSNQLKETKTNIKNESTRTGSMLKRSDSHEGERNAKRPRLESFSCTEDTSDCHSDYSRSSEISAESNFRKKYKHQRNALNALNEIADEIIGTFKNSKPEILNQDENVDLEVMKKSKDPSSMGRKVDKAHLKDEIAAEVKKALKPFYTIGLIDKDDYKDIMRKSVPKIFMNCGNFVNPEKINHLVTSYVKKLTNS